MDMEKRIAAAQFEQGYEEQWADGTWWYRTKPDHPWFPAGETRIDLTMVVIGRFMQLKSRFQHHYGGVIAKALGIDSARISQIRSETSDARSAHRLILGLAELTDFSVPFVCRLMGVKESYCAGYRPRLHAVKKVA